MTLLYALRRLAARQLGIAIERATPMTMPFLRLAETLRQRGVATVLDVGAHEGGFAVDLLEAGFAGRIVSFEPLPEEWQRLRRQAARWPGRWTVAERVALSDRAGAAAFHVAGNRVSSSLLPLGARHTAAAPASATTASITVPTGRLDDLLPALGLDGPFFLKLDVQGAEHLVLAGASDSLRTAIVGVQLEMSLSQLYDGQASAADLHGALAARGFRLWDVIPGFRDPRSLELLQYDGVFYRD